VLLCTDVVRIFPLGGLGEVGMNCLALEQRGEVLVVDCGVTFDSRGLGIDVVHPRFDALEAFGGRIRGLVVTHGHEDHIGAIPYFLRRFDVPVWAPPYSIGLLQARAEEHEILHHAVLRPTEPRRPFEVGSFRVEPIRVTHSIADATALAIGTDAGTIIHTGDFKFDEDPPDGEHFDVARFEELANGGVALLFSDSTNIDAQGPTGSETGVGHALHRLVEDAEGAVVVGLFASNVHRLRLLGAVAQATGRKIVPLGRSMSTHFRVARATGYLDWPDGLVVSPERARDLPKRTILALATGTQAETNAALARLARGEQQNLLLAPGDRVILSSRVIPGNEPQVYGLMGQFLRLGVELKSWASDRAVHVSGHAHRQEQRRMLELVRPRSFVPVHGTLHHLTRHGELAREVGVRDVCVLENGDVGELTHEGVRKLERVGAGRVHVAYGREIPWPVLRERIALAETGVVFAVVVVDERGTIVGEPEITFRGIVPEDEAPEVARDIAGEMRKSLAELTRREREDPDVQRETLRLAARRVVARAFGQKPQAFASVVRAPAV
jgi:ribonuclease J